MAMSSSHSDEESITFPARQSFRRRAIVASKRFDSLLAQQLTGCRAGLTIYVAASRHAPFFQLAQRITAFRHKLRFAGSAIRLAIICSPDLPERSICFPRTCASVDFGIIENIRITLSAKFCVDFAKSFLLSAFQSNSAFLIFNSYFLIFRLSRSLPSSFLLLTLKPDEVRVFGGQKVWDIRST